MKSSNKPELKQIACNHLSDIGCENFITLYKKCTAKPCSFSGIDTTFASGNSLCFRKNLVERI